jgi:hypothetical protein
MQGERGDTFVFYSGGKGVTFFAQHGKRKINPSPLLVFTNNLKSKSK